MFILKKKYYLIIENIRDIDLKKLKKRDKFVIIYRNNNKPDNFEDLLKFRKSCKLKSIELFIANDIYLAVKLKSDGIYISSYNKSYKPLLLRKSNFKIIGSAHSKKEIFTKNQQGCKKIIFSKLFKVTYDKNASCIGVIKFNNLLNIYNQLIPLGGINSENLKYLNVVKSKGFALMSEIKKKPAIANRLF